MLFLSNFGSKIIFMRSVNFWHQQDSNSLFKESIGHVTTQCKWPISVLKNRKKMAAVVFHFVAVVQEHDVFQTLLL